MKNIVYIIFSSILPITIVGMEADFVPSAYSCGASIKADETIIQDTIERGFLCLKQGFKHVYMPGSAKTLQDIPFNLIPLSTGIIIAPGLKTVHENTSGVYIIEGSFKPYILYFYTPKGKNNAELLAYYFKTTSENHEQIYSRYIESGEKPQITRLNHYLVGFLLGYEEADIKAFYDRIKKSSFFDKDKEEAIKYIHNPENLKNAQQWLASLK